MSFDYLRGLVATSLDIGDGTFTGALDVNSYGGPWELDEDLSSTKILRSLFGKSG